MLWGCTHELRLGLWVGVGQMFYLLSLDFLICMCAGGLDTDVHWMLPRPDACYSEPEYDMVPHGYHCPRCQPERAVRHLFSFLVLFDSESLTLSLLPEFHTQRSIAFPSLANFGIRAMSPFRWKMLACPRAPRIPHSFSDVPSGAHASQ